MRELARAVVDHVAALRRARHLGDGEQRLLGGVAEDREDRHARPEVDGIVAPFARGDAQAVKVEKPDSSRRSNETIRRRALWSAKRYKLVMQPRLESCRVDELLQKRRPR